MFKIKPEYLDTGKQMLMWWTTPVATLIWDIIHLKWTMRTIFGY